MEKQRAHQTDNLQNYIQEGTSELIRERYSTLVQSAQMSHYGELDEEVVVLDTETTGFSFSHDELTQIAAARMRNGEIVDWFVTFVNPGKPIPEDVARLTNIFDEDVADAPMPEEALQLLVEFVGTSDIVAHNADFDKSFITQKLFGKPLLENVWIDSLDLARIALPKLKSHRLIDLARAFDAPISTHRADADVEALCNVYRILLAAVEAIPSVLITEIANMTSRDEWATIKVFEHFSGRLRESNSLLINQSISEIEKNELDLEPETKPATTCRYQDNTEKETSSFSLYRLRQDSLLEKQQQFEKCSEGKQSPKKQTTAKPNQQTSQTSNQQTSQTSNQQTKQDAEAIAADSCKSLQFPSSEEIVNAFQKEGMVGGLYDNYEARTEQEIMAEEVRRAFESSSNLAIEAGTGVGKSMAYLLPSALSAQKNNITIGVATKTNALLDQLVYKELPLLKQAFAEKDPEGPRLSYVSLKGFSHYPCLRQVNRILQEGSTIKNIAGKEISQAPSLASLLCFLEQSEYDDIDGLKLDYRVLPRYTITSTSHDCLRRKCPFYGNSCFVHGARKKAESADIVVTNHSLVFCDIAADGGLLPPIRYWVIDEAHGTEDEARRAFSLEISAEEMARLSQRVASPEAYKNVFLRAERRIGTSLEGNSTFYVLTDKARRAGQEFEQAASEFSCHMKDLLYFDPNKSSKGYEYVELWLNDDIRLSATFRELVAYGKLFCDAAEKLIKKCQDLVGFLEDIENAAEMQREIASITLELKEMLNACEIILFSMPSTYAYAATLSKKRDRVVEKLQALLVNVGEKMNETLFSTTHAVVFSSATLTIDGSFGSFEKALGLNETEHSLTRTLELGSSYDFDSQMTIYVVDDMPEPGTLDYLPALQKMLIEVHRAQQGSLLSLFTNRKEMEKCFDTVSPVLKEDDLRVVCQKWGVSVKGLRDDFLTDENLSLFALKSFWEGFDAPGATLRGVIIPKLPFSKPTDPLSCERAQRDDQAWRHYVLPKAVLETKQAAGRLIRGAQDSGCLILADRRLLTKGYGKTFLNSLPSKTIKVCTVAEIAQELATDQT